MSSEARPGRGRRGLPTGVRSGEAQAVGDVLDRLLVERPWRGGLVLGELSRRWEEIVGERLARVSEPASLSEGALLVRVSSAPWAAQIRFLAEDLRARANEVLGHEGVAAVHVTVAEHGRDPSRRR